MPVVNRPIATSTIRQATTETQPRRNNCTAASTVSSSTAALQQLIQNIVVDQGASVSCSTPPDTNRCTNSSKFGVGLTRSYSDN